jgi:hypothetical protein
MIALIFTFPILLAIYAAFDPNRKPIRCDDIADRVNACALESYGETACFRKISGPLEYNRKNIMEVCIPEIKPEKILKIGEHTIYMKDDSRFKSISSWDAMTLMLELCKKKSQLGVINMADKKGTYYIKGFCVTSEEFKKK